MSSVRHVPMKPKARLKLIQKLAFRPDEQPGLFNQGGPVVVLLSDVQEHFEALISDYEELRRDLREARRPEGGSGRGRRRPHHFPDALALVEADRIRRACQRYGADYAKVIQFARLYSEQDGKRYQSWPAAIEIALANEYHWIKPAMRSSSPAQTVGDHQPTERQLAARARVKAAREARDQSSRES